MITRSAHSIVYTSFLLRCPGPSPLPRLAPWREEVVYLTILSTVSLVENNSVWIAFSEKNGKLNHDEHFIDNDVGTEGVNPLHADFQPKQKKNNDVETKEKTKLTKSDAIDYPENAQLTEIDASAEQRSKRQGKPNA